MSGRKSSRFLFLLQQLVEVEPQLAHCLPDRLGDVQVQEIGAEMRAEQEIGRQITDGARRADLVGLRGLDPAREQPVAHGIGKRMVVVVFRRDRGEAPLDVEEVVEEAALDGLDTEPRARGLRRGAGILLFGTADMVLQATRHTGCNSNVPHAQRRRKRRSRIPGTGSCWSHLTSERHLSHSPRRGGGSRGSAVFARSMSGALKTGRS